MKQSIGLAIIVFVISVFIMNSVLENGQEDKGLLVGTYSFLISLGVFLATS